LGEEAEFLKVKRGGPHSNHWALKVVIPYVSEEYSYVYTLITAILTNINSKNGTVLLLP